jgi:hypothetical protein
MEMNEATQVEFAKAAGFPDSLLLARAKRIAEFKEECLKHGGLLSPGGAANLLGVSRQSIDQSMRRGTIHRHDYGELGVYVSVDEVAKRLFVKPKGGAPKKNHIKLRKTD